MSKESEENISQNEESSQSFDSSSLSELSSELPSLSSDVTLPSSQNGFSGQCKERSESLINFFSNSSPFHDGNLPEEDPCLWSESSRDEARSQDTYYEEACFPHVPLLVDPVGWIKYASDPDPWNKEIYSEDSSYPSETAQLTRDIVAACSSKIGQLPDTKAFVFTRLHLNKKGLEDISVLADYKYFHYIDLTDNLLADLEALSNSGYLMYLNASKNKLNSVLDFKPPWFLTHVNLSCNEIREIGTHISNFWSLRHVDLAYNYIEKIEGLGNLKYLKYLDLSHNRIKVLENIDFPNLESLFLESNEISVCLECDESATNIFTSIKELKLAHNKISNLSAFKTLYSIEDLDLEDNCINELKELGHLVGLYSGFKMLNVTNNPVCSSIGYREFIVLKLPSLKILDCVPILCSERVASRMLLEPDLMTGAQQLRATVDLWHQLSGGEGVWEDAVPAGRPPIPLILLVGVFGCLRQEVAMLLTNKYPDSFYRCKKYTTMPVETIKLYDPEILISLSIDDFNESIKSGKFLVHYNEVGFFFAIGREEICHCVLESKIGIVDTIFEAAVTLRLAGLKPYLVLNVANDIAEFEERLKNHYQDMGLWASNARYISEKAAVGDLLCVNSQPLTEVSLKSEEPHNSDSEYHPQSILRRHSAYSKEIDEESFNLTTPGLELPVSQSKITWNLNDSFEELLSNETHTSRSGDRKTDVDKEDNRTEEDESKWTWSLDSTEDSLEAEPSEHYLNMVRGRDYFVQQSLKQQELYVQLNNERPGLFVTAVITDNVEVAVGNVRKVCKLLFCNWKNLSSSEDPMNNPVYGKLVEERVKSLLSELN